MIFILVFGGTLPDGTRELSFKILSEQIRPKQDHHQLINGRNMMVVSPRLRVSEDSSTLLWPAQPRPLLGTCWEWALKSLITDAHMTLQVARPKVPGLWDWLDGRRGRKNATIPSLGTSSCRPVVQAPT